MKNAGTLVITKEDLLNQVSEINIQHGAAVGIFMGLDNSFNNRAYYEAPNGQIQIAQGSIATLSRALKTFELGLTIGKDKGFEAGKQIYEKPMETVNRIYGHNV
jgi:hypothetical protein